MKKNEMHNTPNIQLSHLLIHALLLRPLLQLLANLLLLLQDLPIMDIILNNLDLWRALLLFAGIFDIYVAKRDEVLVAFIVVITRLEAILSMIHLFNWLYNELVIQLSVLISSKQKEIAGLTKWVWGMMVNVRNESVLSFCGQTLLMRHHWSERTCEW